MPNRLADAVSPYLLSHADNPVDWRPWGEEAFAEARRRDVPVLVSVGYSTCHWCHVMARETFSDPALASRLNDGFVAIKVDREEHPEVDAALITAASAFTDQLGWPLNVFTTPEGRTFHAGTYSPPEPRAGHPSFRQVLDAVADAWTTRRDQVEQGAGQLSAAIREASARGSAASPLPDAAALDRVAAELAGFEDAEHGGFGSAPKFPVAPVVLLLDTLAESGVLAPPRAEATRALVRRTLDAMAGSDLRDPVEGGFFRYSTRRDWSEPHYERMLYDNALLLDAYARAGDEDVAAGIVAFLTGTLRRASGGFASAQDSESTVGGRRVEGGYYALDAAGRAAEDPPAVDGKVLTGWNGLAIGALARAGRAFGRVAWIDAARAAADVLLAEHVRADGSLVRASIDGRVSPAVATLEDHGMLADGLLALALATGEVAYAVRARGIVDALIAGADAGAAGAAGAAGGADAAGIASAGAQPGAAGFRVPTGADPVLAGFGLDLASDPSEGAYPSGLTAAASAARVLGQLTADPRYDRAARAALATVAAGGATRPIAFGGALEQAAAIDAAARQLVVVVPDADSDAAESLALIARGRVRPPDVSIVVRGSAARAWADAGFELLADREAGCTGTAYVCRAFSCRLPATTADALSDQLVAVP
ncbi:thioredoxin domain-containing protein [Clavibacter tessellarius]|uniref:thioredoxin domain-containing protein n=1 Tax=Clavibacter tessellarius TaxID=31965 RepID=UPI0039ED5A06